MSDESDVAADDEQAADAIADVQAAMDEARRRVAEAPAEVVVTNHVMGLYELAAIHLSAEQPDLRSAALAIDAVSCLVDGLGDRLGAEIGTLRDALANMRLAFVEVKSRRAVGPVVQLSPAIWARSVSGRDPSRKPRRSAPRSRVMVDESDRSGRRPPARHAR